jgi:hypothetical protein
VSIATPHNGSNFSNVATQWLGRKLINLPDELDDTRELLYRQNPNAFPENSLLAITTAVEALEPSSPAWSFLSTAARAPWIRYHNIIGSLEQTKLLGAVAGKSDGIVKIESARAPYAESEIVVVAEHMQVHRQAATILELRRILLQHLAEMQANQPLFNKPVTAQARALTGLSPLRLPSQRSSLYSVSRRRQPSVPHAPHARPEVLRCQSGRNCYLSVRP